jgi:S-adenosylmethionine decarboxylase
MTHSSSGTHLLIDYWEAENLTNVEFIELALRTAASAANATVLKVMLHGFGEGGGVTGVALLAESHISIHTWPETRYAALDVFVCGEGKAHAALAELAAAFTPKKVSILEFARGGVSKEIQQLNDLPQATVGLLVA